MVLQERVTCGVQDMALHGWPGFAMEAQSTGTAGRSLLCLILSVCIRTTPCAGTWAPCSPVCSEVLG